MWKFYFIGVLLSSRFCCKYGLDIYLSGLFKRNVVACAHYLVILNVIVCLSHLHVDQYFGEPKETCILF